MRRITRERSWPRALPLVVGIGMGLCACGMLFAEDQTASHATHPRQKTRTARRANSDQTRLEGKLEKILANQQAILQKFDAVEEELRIIKVRASSRGSITQ